jgi:hypothetical protein
MNALNDSGAIPDTLQMVDSTVIRAHHHAAGSKGGLCSRVYNSNMRYIIS